MSCTVGLLTYPTFSFRILRMILFISCLFNYHCLEASQRKARHYWFSHDIIYDPAPVYYGKNGLTQFFRHFGSKECRTRSGLVGECTELADCDLSIFSELNEFPIICSRSSPVTGKLCCPIRATTTQTSKVTTTISPDISSNLITSGTECGVSEYSIFERKKRRIKEENLQFVVGGVEAPVNSWPWMAAIFRTSNSGIEEFWCGGIVISEKVILTAAHCLNVRDPSRYTVRVGDNDLRTSDESIHQELDVITLVVHEDYEIGKHVSDLALLILEGGIIYTESAKPICLPQDSASFQELDGVSATLTGWGHLKFGGRPSPTLQQVTFPIVPLKQCNLAYEKLSAFRRIFPEGLNEKFVCAGVDEGGKDACQGDSGGPLMIKRGNSWTLIGIVSFGFKCAQPGFPGIYTRVSSFRSWIRQMERNYAV